MYFQNYLIKDEFQEYLSDTQQDIENTQNTKKIEKKKSKNRKLLLEDYDESFIEHINDTNYLLKEQEIKYKIFKDISSISKIGKNIEIIINIPKNETILSINKIKLSNKINLFLQDIYLTINNKKILSKDQLYNKKIQLSNLTTQESNNEINLHIILENIALNHIINKNIFINYSFIIYKNKVKYV